MKQIAVLEKTIFIFLSVNGFDLYMEFFHEEFVSNKEGIEIFRLQQYREPAKTEMIREKTNQYRIIESVELTGFFFFKLWF